VRERFRRGTLQCPEGVKACSPGLALFASPGSRRTHNPKGPEGATAVLCSIDHGCHLVEAAAPSGLENQSGVAIPGTPLRSAPGYTPEPLLGKRQERIEI
jgi:hypothetical protein